MYAGSQKGQEEDGEDLGVDGLADLCLGHAHLLQGAEPGLVFIALGDLLVVDDESRGQKEQEAQENAQEEQTAEEGEEILLLIGPGFQGDVCFFAVADGFPDGPVQLDLLVFSGPGIEAVVALYGDAAAVVVEIVDGRSGGTPGVAVWGYDEEGW